MSREKEKQKPEKVDFKEALSELKQNEVFGEIYEEIRENSKEHVVEKGDTIASIAKKYGVSSYMELLYLNNILENPIQVYGEKKQKILIWPGDKIFVPKDIEKFKTHFDVIKKTYETIHMNQRVEKKDLRALKTSLETKLYNRRVQSIGLPNILDGFIGNQKAKLDNDLPRIVDSGREVRVTCANLVRTLMGSSVNIGDLREEEKKFLMKQNVHAWILPTELIKIGFDQKFGNLMDSFDRGAIASTNPIDPAKQADYDKTVLELGKYMKEHGNDIKGSLVPYHFSYSRFRGVIADYNAGRKTDYHFNTHQSILAGTDTIKHKAQDVGNVKNGKVEPFYDDKTPIIKELEKLNGTLVQQKDGFEKHKQKLLSSLDLNNNPVLSGKMKLLEKSLRLASTDIKVVNGEKQKVVNESKYNSLVTILDGDNLDNAQIKQKMREVLGYSPTDGFIETVINYKNSINKAKNDLSTISNMLGQDFQFAKINLKDFGMIVSRNPLISENIEEFNKAIDAINGMETKIAELKNEIVKLEEQKVRREQEVAKAKEENVKLNEQLNTQKTQLQSAKQVVLDAINPEKNDLLKKKISVIDEYVHGKIFRKITDEQQKQQLVADFFVALDTDDQEDAATLGKKGQFAVPEKDFKYLRTLYLQKKKVLSNLEDITKTINQDVLNPIDINTFDRSLLNIESVKTSVASYNEVMSNVQRLSADIQSKQDLVNNFDKDQSTTTEKINSAKAEIQKLTETLAQTRQQLEKAKTTIIDNLDPEKNQEIKSLLVQDKKNELSDSIARLKSSLGLKSMVPIDSKGFSTAVKGNKEIMDAIDGYNKGVEGIRKTSLSISENEEKMKIHKTISVVDFICNFIQTRADFSPHVFTNGFKEEILKGIEKYSDLIDLKINGVQIDMKKEIQAYRNNKELTAKIKPSDDFELTGPIMVDGEHQFNHPDTDRKNKMNARTRFFFEFVVPGCYRPTELLEPGKDSSFRKRDFGRYLNQLKVKSTYDLRRGDRLEDVLAEQFELQEGLVKPTIKDGMTKEEYKKQLDEYELKFRRFYAQQIRGLQLAGFMQNEAHINPGAMKINRSIPYYDMSDGSVDKVFMEYINSKKEQYKKDNIEMAPAKNFIEVILFPSDTYRQIFTRISEYIDAHKDKSKFPHLKFVSKLSEIQIIAFMEEFVNRSIKSDKEIDFKSIIDGKFKPNGKMILSLDEIDKFVLEIMTNIGIQRKIETKVIDNAVINLVVGSFQTEQMLRQIVHTETEDTDSFFKRKDPKKLVEKHAWTQDFDMLKISSLGDFQLRIVDLETSGFQDKWITKQQLTTALDLVNENSLKKIDSLSTSQGILINDELKAQYKTDINIVNQIKEIINNPNLKKEDFKVVADLLRKLIIMDDGTGKHIAGKIISAHLMHEKLSVHIRNACGTLTNVGEELTEIYKNKARLEGFENFILVANNLGDLDARYALCENYIFRTCESVGINIPTNSVFYKYPWNEGLYDDRIDNLLRDKVLGKKVDNMSTQQKGEELMQMLDKGEITEFDIIKYDIENPIKKIRNVFLGKSRFNLDIFRMHLGDYAKYIDSKSTNLTGKDKLIMQKISAFCKKIGDGGEGVMEFLKDPEIKEFLRSKGKSDSIIPEQNEYLSTMEQHPFRRSIFNYVNKEWNREQDKIKEKKDDTASVQNFDAFGGLYS